MKRLTLLILVLSVLFTCCSAKHYGVQNPQVAFDAGEVLYNKYPELVEYYNEGVLKITSLREIQLPDGGYDYDINYRFVRYYYTGYTERAECLRNRFPSLYYRYIGGDIGISTLYKYVDLTDMVIKYYISYYKIGSYYRYNYYHYAPYRPIPPRYHRPYPPRQPVYMPRPNHPHGQPHNGGGHNGQGPKPGGNNGGHGGGSNYNDGQHNGGSPSHGGGSYNGGNRAVGGSQNQGHRSGGSYSGGQRPSGSSASPSRSGGSYRPGSSRPSSQSHGGRR